MMFTGSLRANPPGHLEFDACAASWRTSHSSCHGLSQELVELLRRWWPVVRHVPCQLFETGGSLHKTEQKATVGALARYFTPRGRRDLTRDDFRLSWTGARGNRADIFPLPAGRAKAMLKSRTPDAVSRFFANQCAMGSFLSADMSRLKD